METSPKHMEKIMNPEIWTPTGERRATEEEVRLIGELALNDNIMLSED